MNHNRPTCIVRFTAASGRKQEDRSSKTGAITPACIIRFTTASGSKQEDQSLKTGSAAPAIIIYSRARHVNAAQGASAGDVLYVIKYPG